MSAPRAETQMTLCTAELAALELILQHSSSIVPLRLSFLPDVIRTATGPQVSESHAVSVLRVQEYANSALDVMPPPLHFALTRDRPAALDAIGLFRTTVFGWHQGIPLWVDLSLESVYWEHMERFSHHFVGHCLCCAPIAPASEHRSAVAPDNLHRALFREPYNTRRSRWAFSPGHSVACPLVLTALAHLGSAERNKVRGLVHS